MKQLGIFAEDSATKSSKKKESSVWRLFVDGASKNNPGLAGAGVCLTKNNELVYCQGFFLGKKTNNQAEYIALLLGLFYARKQVKKDDIIHILSDSELMVRQLKGIYKVKDVYLKELFSVAQLLTASLEGKYVLHHIVREKNEVADALANSGIDKKMGVPLEFITYLQTHDVKI